VVGLVAGLALAAVVVACGAGMSKPAAPPQSVGASGAGPVDPRAKIEELDKQITADLEKMGVAQPAAPVIAPSAPTPLSTAEILASCEPPSPPPGTCGDTCNLAKAICDNAQQICDLAKELAGDAWATEKCDGGKRSCEAARKDCCDCR
jgi:hypothetical protein